MVRLPSEDLTEAEAFLPDVDVSTLGPLLLLSDVEEAYAVGIVKEISSSRCWDKIELNV